MLYGFLDTPDMTIRGDRLIATLKNAARMAGKKTQVTKTYEPCDVLVVYGMGGATRYQVSLDHVKNGGILVAFDLGFWSRFKGERKYKIALQGMHSPQYIMRGPSPGPDRWKENHPATGNYYDPAGPIVIAGCGPKSQAIGAYGWSASISKEIRAKFPNKKIVYRTKPKRQMEDNVDCDDICKADKVDDALKGASLVVCLHSNVAVDACRLGVPVVCETGAAAAIYPSGLDNYKNQPDAATCKDFLHRLAWWQWTTDEMMAGNMWPWLEKQIANV